MRDEKLMKYIPKKYHERISEAWIELEKDYNEKTGKMENRYYIVLDDEEHCFNSINYLLFSLKNVY